MDPQSGRRGAPQGDLGPKLRQIQGQLNTIEAELTYVVSSRYAELNAQLAQDPRRPSL
jgi:hypothetical protein